MSTASEAAPPVPPAAAGWEIAVEGPGRPEGRFPLDRVRYTIGRAAQNDYSVPDDPLLSRLHLALEWDGRWCAVDLGSKNGTLLNGERLAIRQPLKDGDRLEAGQLTIKFRRGAEATSGAVFVDESTPIEGAVFLRLDEMRQTWPRSLGVAEPGAKAAGDRMAALIRAGNELVGHQPLEELFPTILKLARESVGAQRGVLLTLENGELVARAAEGDNFLISSAVRDKVIGERASMLVRDVGLDQALRDSLTIVQQRVRSLMAVPLQTENAVIGIIYVDTTNLLRPFSQEDLGLLTVLANTAAIRIERSRHAEVEQAEKMMRRELEQAAEIQRSLLPAGTAAIPGIDVSGQSVACRSVGGDYFDYFTLRGEQPGFIVADVAGKGLPAALMMTNLQATAQLVAEDESDPGAILTRVNRSIAARCPGNRFITCVFAALDPATGELAWANAGHNPPLLMRASGFLEPLDGGGPPLGLFKGLAYETSRSRLEPDDVLLLFSDGIPDACDADGEEFGDARLTEALLSARRGTARDVQNEIWRSLSSFLGTAAPNDDVTLVAIRLAARH
jgi:serine phosphatase RsbU (regulator of sigma subunit)